MLVGLSTESNHTITSRRRRRRRRRRRTATRSRRGSNIISSNERTPNYNVLCFNNSGHAKENPKARSRRFHPIICGSFSSDAISSPVGFCRFSG